MTLQANVYLHFAPYIISISCRDLQWTSHKVVPADTPVILISVDLRNQDEGYYPTPIEERIIKGQAR